MALPSKAVSSLSLGQRLWNSLSAWTIKASGYQKLGNLINLANSHETESIKNITTGLLREDLYNEDDADVREAIRRLPEKEQQLRLFRLKRAIDLSMKHSLLPKEQWTSTEQVFSIGALRYSWFI